jgi:hypothetical protein
MIGEAIEIIIVGSTKVSMIQMDFGSSPLACEDDLHDSDLNFTGWLQILKIFFLFGFLFLYCTSTTVYQVFFRIMFFLRIRTENLVLNLQESNFHNFKSP